MSETITEIRRSPYAVGASTTRMTSNETLRGRSFPDDSNLRGQIAEIKNITVQDSLGYLAKEAEELHESLCRLAARLQPIRRELDSNPKDPQSPRPPQCEIQSCIEGLRERCRSSQMLLHTLHETIQL